MFFQNKCIYKKKKKKEELKLFLKIDPNIFLYIIYTFMIKLFDEYLIFSSPFFSNIN